MHACVKREKWKICLKKGLLGAGMQNAHQQIDCGCSGNKNRARSKGWIIFFHSFLFYVNFFSATLTVIKVKSCSSRKR